MGKIDSHLQSDLGLVWKGLVLQSTSNDTTEKDKNMWNIVVAPCPFPDRRAPVICTGFPSSALRTCECSWARLVPCALDSGDSTGGRERWHSRSCRSDTRGKTLRLTVVDWRCWKEKCYVRGEKLDLHSGEGSVIW
jgi:hypothetical protein